jgi:hypothetical protein
MRASVLIGTAVGMAVVLTMAASDAMAQTRPARNFRTGMATGVGYTSAVPEALAGAGAFHFFGGRGIGVFGDVKLTVPSLTRESTYCPTALGDCSTAWVTSERNDQDLGVTDEWIVVNAGVMYAITPELAVMAGAGIARQESYREFFHDESDPTVRITPTGGYYVDENAGWTPQAVGGLLFRAGMRLAFRFGYETAPGGMSFGVYFVP